jgi:inorganic triphosphatase YgiF
MKRDSTGKFAEGNTGRKAGTPNKATTEIKEAFQMLLEDNLPTLQRDISSLAPKERVKFMLELASFIIPKMKAIDVKSENTETVFIDFSEDISFEEN